MRGFGSHPASRYPAFPYEADWGNEFESQDRRNGKPNTNDQSEEEAQPEFELFRPGREAGKRRHRRVEGPDSKHIDACSIDTDRGEAGVPVVDAQEVDWPTQHKSGQLIISLDHCRITPPWTVKAVLTVSS